MNKENKIRLPLKQSVKLIVSYISNRVLEQFKKISIIILYLVFFQTIILKMPLYESGMIALGLVIIIIGLAFFFEGIMLGLMPLGESLGLKLPKKAKLPFILVFSFVLGVLATIAEPAVGALKANGIFVKAWEAPLLFVMLNKYTFLLVTAIGIGVGIAAFIAMLKYFFSLSIKPILYVSIILLLIISIFSIFDKNLLYILGLAWDSGGITTGPVTVPLVVALGIGVSRIVSKTNSGLAGFGIVTLASLIPVLTVLILGASLLGKVPEPDSSEKFFEAQNKDKIVSMFESEEDAEIYILKNTNFNTWMSYFGSKDEITTYIENLLSDTSLQNKIFSDKKDFNEWIKSISDAELALFLTTKYPEVFDIKNDELLDKTESMFGYIIKGVLLENLKVALLSIAPLIAFLFIVYFIFIREKLFDLDIIILGIVFSIVGLTLFNFGKDLGFVKLGKQTGEGLPVAIKRIKLSDKKKVFKNLDMDAIQKSVKEDGTIEKFFYYKENGKYKTITFDEKYYDSEKKIYAIDDTKGPLFGENNIIPGFIIILIFCFFMGYSATLAEPALNALAYTVEELTVGTFNKNLLIQSVSVGVGVGIMVGAIKILFDIPLIYLLIPPYILLLILTKFTEEQFVSIAWDSAGVTTGPVTVPLVIAIGLGLSSQVGVVEGFGILAAASAFPILSVLSTSMYISFKRKSYLSDI
ncbi:MAG: DUF1538 family protein [Spirochaetes bacterium]|nr:DUF1538 family protein [Spirochaetota bacterium]